MKNKLFLKRKIKSKYLRKKQKTKMIKLLIRNKTNKTKKYNNHNLLQEWYSSTFLNHQKKKSNLKIKNRKKKRITFKTI